MQRSKLPYHRYKCNLYSYVPSHIIVALTTLDVLTRLESHIAHLSPKSRRTYLSEAKNMLDKLGSTILIAIENKDATAWKEIVRGYLLENRRFPVLATINHIADAFGLPRLEKTEIPTSMLKKPAPRFSELDYKKLLWGVWSIEPVEDRRFWYLNKNPIRWRTVKALAIAQVFTGARFADLVNLRKIGSKGSPKTLWLKSGEITMYLESKTTSRSITLLASDFEHTVETPNGEVHLKVLFDYLYEFLAESPHVRPFLWGFRNEASLYRRYYDVLEYFVGVKGTHNVRRAYITRLLDAGIPPVQVQLWVGHKNITTTMRYYRGHRPTEKKVLDALLG